MKLKTDYTVSLTMEEAGKALSKFVEKKTGKKVLQVSVVAIANSSETGDKLEQAFSFTLQGEESVIDKENA